MDNGQWRIESQNNKKTSEIYQKIAAHLADDFDTVRALATIHELVDELDADSLADLASLDEHILKLWLFVPEVTEEIPPAIRELAERRWQAKLAKDWASADTLRKELTDAGREMLDGKDGYEVVKG